MYDRFEGFLFFLTCALFGGPVSYTAKPTPKKQQAKLRKFRSEDRNICPKYHKMQTWQLGGGFKHFWNVHPEPWRNNDPIWRFAYFSNGLVKNHQLGNRFPFINFPVYQPDVNGTPGSRCAQALQQRIWVLDSRRRCKVLGEKVQKGLEPTVWASWKKGPWLVRLYRGWNPIQLYRHIGIIIWL